MKHRDCDPVIPETFGGTQVHALQVAGRSAHSVPQALARFARDPE
jgi:hypothetical protein